MENGKRRETSRYYNLSPQALFFPLLTDAEFCVCAPSHGTRRPPVSWWVALCCRHVAQPSLLQVRGATLPRRYSSSRVVPPQGPARPRIGTTDTVWGGGDWLRHHTSLPTALGGGHPPDWPHPSWRRTAARAHIIMQVPGYSACRVPLVTDPLLWRGTRHLTNPLPLLSEMRDDLTTGSNHAGVSPYGMLRSSSSVMSAMGCKMVGNFRGQEGIKGMADRRRCRQTGGREDRYMNIGIGIKLERPDCHGEKTQRIHTPSDIGVD